MNGSGGTGRHYRGEVALPCRRDWLRGASMGFGWLALNGLLADRAGAETHHAAKARSVIFCFMDGGPSHVDTFDPKPMLKIREGQKIGQSAVSRKSQSAPNRVWLGSPWEFRQRGRSGLWVSDLFPHLAGVADELCVVNSMVGELPLHGQSNLLLHTGRSLGQAPSFGSWVSYGLGSENRNLPGYIVLNNDWVPNGGLENFEARSCRRATRPRRCAPRAFPWTTSFPGTPPMCNDASWRW